ncbi:hypothetical protein TWF281_008951 [Arthrobotrys megalospora]
MAWSVVKLTITANTSNGVADRLYANGNMQVPIDVAITAIDGAGKPYYLSDQELAAIQLVDYNNVDRQLSGKWKYTDQENEFAHIIDGVGRSVSISTDAPGASADASDHLGFQTKRYWVSTTGIENQKIAAAITEPNGNYYTTHSKVEDNFAILRGVSPIIYNTENVRINRDYNDTTTGSYDLSSEREVLGGRKTITEKLGWKAQNYHLSMDRGSVRKAEIYGYYTSSSALNYSIKYQPVGRGLIIFYMWPLGSQRDMQTGVLLTTTHAPIFRVEALATVPTNNRRGSLCFTRVHYAGSEAFPIPWDDESHRYEQAGCKIYDEWGNWAQFKIIFTRSGKDQDVAIIDTN